MSHSIDELTDIQKSVLDLYLRTGGNSSEVARSLGKSRASVRDSLKYIEHKLGMPRSEFLDCLGFSLKEAQEKFTTKPFDKDKRDEREDEDPKIKVASGDFDFGSKSMGKMSIESESPISIEDALEFAGFDHEHWEITKVRVGGHQVPMRQKQGQAIADLETTKGSTQSTMWLPDIPLKMWCTKWTVEAKPRAPEIIAAERILEDMRKLAPVKEKIRRARPLQGCKRRALEVDFPDVHLGLRCFSPASDGNYDPEVASDLVRQCRDKLLDDACSKYGPFEEIVWFFGHDWLHCDNLKHETTQGTGQPEADAYQTIYRTGYDLAVETALVLSEVAPLKIYVIPGNHDRVSCMTLGIALEGRFSNDENVTVFNGNDPYKFWKYGANLIGADHGHSLKPMRMASVMASETRKTGWADAEYCEWHLGDQHRAGQGTPIKMEEQSVSIEYLPGLTMPNEWHKLKGFNHQKRCATAYIWNHEAGQEARLRAIVRPETNQLA